jgi:hypothetical protein
MSHFNLCRHLVTRTRSSFYESSQTFLIINKKFKTMKKLLFLFVAFLLIALNGCEKDQSNFEAILILKNELNKMANSKVNGQVNIDPCNGSNPYDAWGEALFMGFTKVSLAKSESIKALFADRNEFEKKLRSEIPQEYLTLDTNKVNLENVKLLCDEFLSLYISRSIFDALQLSNKMEDHVNKSKILNEVDKAYLLKFVSLVRYSTYLNFTLNCYSKSISDRSFEQCWKASLQAIEDGGPFQKIACVIDWPMCLAIIAADCAYEQLTQ